jgi:hypothetical protein
MGRKKRTRIRVRISSQKEAPLDRTILPRQTLEEFTADTIPVKRIVQMEISSEGSDEVNSGSLPVALFDMSKHGDINLSDLARLHIFERDASTKFDWTLAETSDDVLIRLTCTYDTPVQEQFALLLRYRQHHEFLRWVLEHNNLLPLADQEWMECQGPDKYLVLYTNDDDLAGSLRIMLMHQVLTREQRTPDLEEMVRIIFDVKRYLSLEELTTFASEILHIPIRGHEEQMIQNATQGPNAALLVQQISREFRVFLLQILVLDGIATGLYQGKVHLFTEAWLKEQQG